MDKQPNYRTIAAEAGTYALIGFALNVVQMLIYYAMDPEVLVEEKTWLKENSEILKVNFTK